jgi:hypothetical protein
VLIVVVFLLNAKKANLPLNVPIVLGMNVVVGTQLIQNKHWVLPDPISLNYFEKFISLFMKYLET